MEAPEDKFPKTFKLAGEAESEAARELTLQRKLQVPSLSCIKVILKERK